MLINIDNPASPSRPARRFALFELGFRPFFLSAGLAGALLLLLWGFTFDTGSRYMVWPAFNWHGHEMVFGYVAAVVAGFLLTAAKNWTGRQTLKGTGLMLLALLWLGGRLAALSGDLLPTGVVALIDLAFIPALAVAVAIPIVQSRNYRNLVFIGILLVYALANAAFHVMAAGLVDADPLAGIYAGLYTIILLISVMGGRVIPFFIERGLNSGFRTTTRKPVEQAATVLLVLFGVLQVAGVTGWTSAAIALAAAVAHGIRLAGWYNHGVWRVPLLWILVTAYGWLVIGLLLMAPAMLDRIPVMLALHALTAGGIGLVTAGMMVRVSMGHSGRKLHAPGSLVVAFMLLNLAAIVRVLVPLFAPDTYADAVFISAMLWFIAFAIFVIRMAPVYWSPRVDGRPG